MAIRLCAILGFAVMAFSSAGALAQGPRFPDPQSRPLMPRPEWEAPGPMMAWVPGAAMPGADPFELLENSKEVQADLGLTPAQLRNLHLAALNFRNKLQELTRPRPGVPPDQVRAEIEQHILSTRGMIARELTPRQLDRLQQIMLQLEGPCLAALDPEVAGHLGLNSGQAHALSAACQRRAEEMRSAFRPPTPGEDFCAAMATNRDRISEIRARADQEITALLQPPQKAALQQLMGRKIHLEPPIPPNCRL